MRNRVRGKLNCQKPERLVNQGAIQTAKWLYQTLKDRKKNQGRRGHAANWYGTYLIPSPTGTLANESPTQGLGTPFRYPSKIFISLQQPECPKKTQSVSWFNWVLLIWNSFFFPDDYIIHFERYMDITHSTWYHASNPTLVFSLPIRHPRFVRSHSDGLHISFAILLLMACPMSTWESRSKIWIIE